MEYDVQNKDLHERIVAWGQEYHALIERWQYILNDLKATSVLTYTMFFVAIREMLDLTQTTIQATVEMD